MKRLLSLVLSLSLLLTMSTGFADKNEALSASKDVIENIALPDIIEEDEAIENKYVGRLAAMEQDLSTFVFANEDGTQTLRMFSHPVKYVDEEGKTKDITLEIAPAENGAFKTKDNSIITTFEKKLADGISLEYDDIDLLLKPTTASALSVASSDGETVIYPYGQHTSLEYALTYTGFKEDIVVEQYTGQTEYEFTLYTNGLKVEKIGEAYKVVDGEGNIKANIGDIIIFTADERNNTFGELTCETVKENEEYLLTIHIDADYLSDPKTAYPIHIDPTLEINYSGSGETAIQDVTINSTGGSDGSSGSLRVGKRETYGISRILMKFPGLSAYSALPNDQIVKAAVEIRDIMCESDALTVYCYQFAGNTWSESTANWSNVNPSSIGSLLSSNTVSYANGVTQETYHRYSFDITSAVTTWGSDYNAYYKGIIFKASSSVENGSAYISKTFSSYERSSNQPSLSIIYVNPYYSTFNGNVYTNTVSNVPNEMGHYQIYDDNLQLRANCYGYALRMFCAAEDTNYYAFDVNGEVWYLWGVPHGYLQQPGEFSDLSEGVDIYDNGVWSYNLANYPEIYAKYKQLYADTDDNSDEANADRMAFTYSLVCKDMESLDYNIISTTEAALSQPIQLNKRLCLLVVGWGTKGTSEDYGPDYHFYMQHSDGTWSHKLGLSAAQGTCIDDHVELTNDNILDHALEGTYAGGKMQFFYVDKPAIVDYSHYEGAAYVEKTVLWQESTGASGSTMNTARKITSYTTTGSVEYIGDVDYYWIKAAYTGTSTIRIISPFPVKITLYSENGDVLHTYGIPGACDNTFTGSCIKDEVYYFKITAYNNSQKCPIGVNYSLSIS